MIIEIEKMLFGDYRVSVWDKDLNGVLDRNYFCRGYDSALLTAKEIRTLGDEFKDLPIWSRDMNNLEKLND